MVALTPSPRRRAILYTRISDARAAMTRLSSFDMKAMSKEEKAGMFERGVVRQLEQCQEVADRLDVEVVARFKENDLSAYKPHVVRPMFERTLEMVRSGQADMIIVWHLDRYMRRNSQLQRLIDAADQYGVEIHGATSGAIRLDNATGRLVARQMVSFAEYESEHHAERRVLANNQRAVAGQWSTANRPFGYNMDGTPREPEAQAVRDAATAILSGKSIRSIARQWNEAGLTTTRGKTWSGSQLRKMITKPRYAAILTHRGETYEGKWQYLIEPHTFHALVNYVNNPARSNGRVSWDQRWLGSGLYYCGVCQDGTRMQSAGKSPLAYICRKRKHLHIAGDHLDKFVVGRILEWFARENCHELVHTPKNMQKLLHELEEIDGEIAVLATAKVGVTISASVLIAANEDLLDQRRKIEAKLGTATGLTTTPAATLINASREAHRAGEDAGNAVRDLWLSLSVTQRAQAIDEVATVTIRPAQDRGPLRGKVDTRRVALEPRQPFAVD